MIKNFRYSCTWERFVKAVEIVKELEDSNKAYWAVGFLNEFTLFCDDVEIEEDIRTIIADEIIYLLHWYLDYRYDFGGKEIDEEEIRSVVSAGQNGKADEEELNQLVKNIQNKLELVKDAVDIERLFARYKVKQDAVNLKLFDFKYNVYTQYISEGENAAFAFVNMICKKKLRGRKQEPDRLFVEHEQGESVTFICDEEDIDLLIAQLNEMKQKIKGELQ